MSANPNCDLMLHVLQTRKVEVSRLFDEYELVSLERHVKDSIVNGSKTRLTEDLATAFLNAYNERAEVFNARAAAYNESVYNGTHPALGKGLLRDMWDGITGVFK